MKRTKTKVTQELFDLVKVLETAGLSRGQIVKASKASYYVVMLFEKCKKFEDYKEVARNYWASQPKVKKEVLPEVKPLSGKFDEHNSIITLLRAIEHNQQEMIAIMQQKRSWFR